jgi:hypothetical protein
MQIAKAGTSQVAMVGRVLEPDQATLDAGAEREILDLMLSLMKSKARQSLKGGQTNGKTLKVH